VPSLAGVPVNPPAALGRGVVINAGDRVPEPWVAAREVLVDDDAFADPTGVVTILHEAWAGRRAVVVRLAIDPTRFRDPPDIEVAEPWRLDPGYELWHERLHFLVWANSYDARDGEPVWWWGRKAERLGAASPHRDAIEGAAASDVVLPGGTPAWIDGGPRGDRGLREVGGVAVVHAESIDRGLLAPVPAGNESPADRRLAPDQSQAVSHGAGPARVIAPAGSGKTRVLTERLRHLVVGRGYEPEGVVAVAYNRKARDEMVARTPGLRARILTLNALGYEIVAAGLGRRPEVLDVRHVRQLLEPLVPRVARRLNTDPLAPYVDALSAVRLGLRDPIDVEDERGDVPGLADAFPAYRAELRRRGVVDFDEQVLLAIELLVGRGAFRRAQQSRHRHLLVDEFQDLTPAHVLLIRLLAAPRFDVFGVGDDDQVIYGHAGASPRFLTDFARYFPGATELALEVNYRCPPAVVDAASKLLSYNSLRVEKAIRAGRPAADEDAAPELLVERHDDSRLGDRLVELVRESLDAGALPSEVAVLTRVNAGLLAPQLLLGEAGIPVDAAVGERMLDRTGTKAALAWLRLAVAASGGGPSEAADVADDEWWPPDPEGPSPASPRRRPSGQLQGGDLALVARRPSRGMSPGLLKALGNGTWGLSRLASFAEGGKDDRSRNALTGLHDDVAMLGRLVRDGAGAAELLLTVRDKVGLAGALGRLDDARSAPGGGHLDDLDALVLVARAYDASADRAHGRNGIRVAGFETWLRERLHNQAPPEGPNVTLSTVHRVKGLEWPHVVVWDVSEGVMPHRLNQVGRLLEEERRVFHVALTRAQRRAVVLSRTDAPSQFLDELTGEAPHRPRVVVEPERPGRAKRVVTSSGKAKDEPLTGDAAKHSDGLRDWRRKRAKEDGVPAYVVLNDRHLDGIARRAPTTLDELARCDGIGATKLDRYGDEILAVLDGG
jgi:DNA helicase-2/ATP-dependent DNA helicase PcrA